MGTAAFPPCELHPGEVHVWQFSLSPAPVACLSADEEQRASRFVFEKDRVRFIAGRSSLRRLLGRYTGSPPADIHFDYEPRGKPVLTGWHFNLSHSRDAAAVAVSIDVPLGIDLEFIDPGFPRDDTAGSFLAEEEVRLLQALPESEQAAHFFDLWTAKEALLKAIGSGFSVDPREVRIRAGDPPMILPGIPALAGARLHRLDLGAGFAANLATLAPVSKISLFTLISYS